MDKTFVLDTNVILFDPQAINKFGKNKVVVPLIVIEEVDRFKKDQNENGRNARHFSRIIDDLRMKGHLVDGVDLDNGGKLYLTVDTKATLREKTTIDLNVNDNIILGAALSCKEAGENTLLVTKDINLRLKADVMGIPAEDYGQRDVSADELYKGQRTVEVEEELINFFETEKFLPLRDIGIEDAQPNEYFIMHLPGNDRRRALGRYDQKKEGIVPLINLREGVW